MELYYLPLLVKYRNKLATCMKKVFVHPSRKIFILEFLLLSGILIGFIETLDFSILINYRTIVYMILIIEYVNMYGIFIHKNAGSQGEKGWCTLLQNNLRKTYENSVSFTNVSMGGNASYAGYVRTMALNDDVGYDLAIICYGQNDGADGFSTNYESSIRAIRTKYPDCSIIAILESSQREYTEKMTTIQNICDHYSIPVADTIAAFNNSGKAYVAPDRPLQFSFLIRLHTRYADQ